MSNALYMSLGRELSLGSVQSKVGQMETELLQISAVTKSEQRDCSPTITGVCGVDRDGTPWHLTIQEVVDGMQRGDWLFFVFNGERARWIVISEENSTKCLRAEGDTDTNALSTLPECLHADRSRKP